MHSFQYDPAARRKRQNPEEILAAIGLSAGMTFVDVGCNDGFFALPAARMVGKEGMVYGIDIDAEAVRRLLEGAKEEGLSQVSAQTGEAERTVSCEHCADIVFFGTVLHDFHDPSMVLKNAGRMLKARGKLVNFDWKKKPTELGPPLPKRLSEEEAAKLIQGAGLVVEEVKDISENYYQIIARNE